MSGEVLVAPSLLSANWLELAQELTTIEHAGADYHHVDVMDGHYVPNLTFGIPLIKQIKSASKIPLDVHLMVEQPEKLVGEYLEAGADIFTFHPEACRHPHRLIQTITESGAKAGVALNPGTPVGLIKSLLGDVDLVLMMSVNPGFGGQKFIPATIGKIKELVSELQTVGRLDEVMIEVDGGVNAETAAQVVAVGATMLVAGTYVFQSADRRQAIANLKEKPH